MIKFKIGKELFAFIEPNVIPKNKAKKIVPSISPFANALIGFVGIILFKISNIDVEDVSLLVSKASILSIFAAPIPGCIVFAKNRPIKIAIKLVDM